MIDISKIEGIIFDYGGTLDSNGKHWAEVLWEAYQDNKVPVEKIVFREAYVYGERYLAMHPIIEPQHTFKDLLVLKVDLQLKWLVENGFLQKNDKTSCFSLAISNQCYNFAACALKRAEPILQKMSKKYPLVLVSNFYGNVEAVLEDFGLTKYFQEVVESAVVGVRKPDPAIFALGVKALNLKAEQVIVIGDSHAKDIVPATIIACKTIWIKGIAWEEETEDLTADIIITDIMELSEIFNLE
ncbi:hypothetical protein AwDysgo_00150 [Bacteroidales bacterium]|nr:hypothetical protein AwDysgo_00150 [Bacteroidales bacterium]